MSDLTKLSGASLDTVIIFTTQMEALAEFYRSGLALAPFERLPGHLGQQVGNAYVGFDHIPEDANQSKESNTEKSFGATPWFTVENLDATFERFVNLGARIRTPPADVPWGARLASLYDLDGNLFGLAQRKDETHE